MAVLLSWPVSWPRQLFSPLSFPFSSPPSSSWLSSGSKSLWTLPDVPASNYALPFIYNKPSPPPIPRSTPVFLYISFFIQQGHPSVQREQFQKHKRFPNLSHPSCITLWTRHSIKSGSVLALMELYVHSWWGKTILGSDHLLAANCEGKTGWCVDPVKAITVSNFHMPSVACDTFQKLT